MSERTESDKYLAPEQILEKLEAKNAELRESLLDAQTFIPAWLFGTHEKINAALKEPDDE